MSISEQISPFLGRLVIGWFFLSEAWWRLDNWEGTITLMHMRHISNAYPILGLALIVMALGAFALILGYQTRHGALLLFAYIIIESVFIHDYWRVSNLIDRDADYDLFIRNMAVAGGLLVLVGMGGGPFALDNRPQRAVRRR